MPQTQLTFDEVRGGDCGSSSGQGTTNPNEVRGRNRTVLRKYRHNRGKSAFLKNTASLSFKAFVGLESSWVPSQSQRLWNSEGKRWTPHSLSELIRCIRVTQSKAVRHKINVQRSMVFLYANNKGSEKEMKKRKQFLLQLQQIYT